MESIERIAVFGGDGFIGRYIVRRLAAKGARVIVYGRRARQAGFLRTMGDPGQIILADGDARDRTLVASVLSDCTAAINLVGILQQSGRQNFFALHRDAAKLIAEEAARTEVRRLIHMSALGADPSSASLYAKSKGEGERAVFDAFPAATILRPSVIFGAEDNFFNRFANMAKISPVLPLVGGSTKFQPVYVDDVAAAAVATLVRPTAAGWIYEIGGQQTYRFDELIAVMLTEMGIRRRIVELPLPVASLIARLTSILPNPPITQDQIRLLQKDSVVSPTASGLDALGIVATPLETILPKLLARFGSPQRRDLPSPLS